MAESARFTELFVLVGQAQNILWRCPDKKNAPETGILRFVLAIKARGTPSAYIKFWSPHSTLYILYQTSSLQCEYQDNSLEHVQYIGHPHGQTHDGRMGPWKYSYTISVIVAAKLGYVQVAVTWLYLTARCLQVHW